MQWPEDVRCELIEGVVYDMAPAPALAHQAAVVDLAVYLRSLLMNAGQGDESEKTPCQVLISPVDVVLASDTVVQPDLIVVCDPSKLANGKNVQGPPDIVFEVLLPRTAVKDRREKLRLYERMGVPEYVIIDPVEHYAEYYRLDNEGRYGPADVLSAEEPIPLQRAPGTARTLGEILSWPEAEDAPILLEACL